MTSEIQTVAYEDFLQEIKSDVKTPFFKSIKTSKNGKQNEILETERKNKDKSTASIPCVEVHTNKKNKIEATENDVKEKKKDATSISYTDFLTLFKSPPPVLKEKAVACDEETQQDATLYSTNKAIKCKSITSYFSKSNGKTTKSNIPSSDTNKVLVTAQIHSPQSTCRKESIPSMFMSRNSPSNTKPNEEADSILLLSTETLDNTKEILKDENLSTKKRKQIDPPVQEAEFKKQKFGTEILNVTTHEGQTMTKSCNACVGPEPQLGSNISQSTLSFGIKGLSLIKSEIKKSETAKEPSKKPGKVSENAITGKKLPPNDTTANTEANFNLTPIKGNNKNNADCSSQAVQIIEVATETEDDKDIEVLAIETPTLRRSARIKQTPKLVEETLMEVDDDSEEDTPRSKKNKRTTASLQKQELKQTGKLAPIFTQVKSKGTDIKIYQPAVDPEALRLKREFLMSGIPDELKRQINTAANSVLVSDYPTLPKVSHVQRLELLPNSTHNNKVFPLRSLNVSVFDESYSSVPFSWEITADDSNTAVSTLFQNFSSHPTLTDEFVNKLLQKHQTIDNSICYEKLFKHWKTKLQAQEEPKGSPELREDEDIIVVDETSPRCVKKETKQTVEAKDCLWTDLHQPESADHIVGNSSAIKHLKSWLETWKSSLQKEQKRAYVKTKPVMKSKKTSTWSDDSDFTDSDEEEMRLCNTMLVTGPHGLGKTSAVYALAHELGFKVFEVNSSSLRSGKQLLSQLEEATQSHKVAQKITAAPVSGEVLIVDDIEEKVSRKDNLINKAKAKPPASSVANFFKRDLSTSKVCKKKTSSKNSANDVKKLALKRNTQNESNISGKDKKSSSQTEETNEQSVTSGHVNLATVSLILFDEVDVVFEEDKGFLATVQHFMNSTKIPIILTCSEPDFYRQLSSRYDEITFKKPSKLSLARYLSTVCLSHSVYVDLASVSSLVAHHKSDIRRCLLSLQYWCESGGGRIQEGDNCSCVALSYNGYTSQSKSKKKNVIADEDSGQSKDASVTNQERENSSSVVHKDVVEILQGLPSGESFSLQTVLKLLTVSLSNNNTFNAALQLTQNLNSVFHCNSIYQVALFSLPLPKVDPVAVTMTAPAKKAPSRTETKKRILQAWCDSDSSSDTADGGPKISNQSETVQSAGSNRPDGDDHCTTSNIPSVDSDSNKIAKCGQKQLNISILSEMARFYDSISYMDCMDKLNKLDSCGTSPGMHDQELTPSKGEWFAEEDLFKPLGCAVSLLATRNLRHKVDLCIRTWTEGKDVSEPPSSAGHQAGVQIKNWPEDFHLPVGKTCLLTDDSPLPNSSKNVGITKNVISSIGNTILESDQRLFIDYLPYIREMSRTEKDRHLAKSQRRFHHYFNTIGLCLDQLTIDALSL